MTTKKNSLLFKIKTQDDNHDFNVNNFIDLFLEDGLLESYLDEIYGIATHNYILKIYNVTFKETTPKTTLDEIYETFSEPQEVTNKDNLDFTIQVNRPPGYRQLITLYPMPFDITSETLKEITQTWGDLKFFEFGRHKKCPLIRNPYLHIYLENLKRREIPDSINFRHRYIAVNIDGENAKDRCNYCKSTNHQIDECPKKTSLNKPATENKTPSRIIQHKPTYAKTITSTPKNTEPQHLHPMTKLKLSKKNIEKTIENFPTLQQNTTSPHSEKPLHPESSSTSPNTYQEKHDKPLDNVQTAKVPLDCKIKENNPELPTTSKENETQKRKHSPSPQTSIPPVDLKPRKKRANSKEKTKKI